MVRRLTPKETQSWFQTFPSSSMPQENGTRSGTSGLKAFRTKQHHHMGLTEPHYYTMSHLGSPISVLSFKHNHNDIHNQQHFTPDNFGSLFCFPTGVREIHCIETKGNKKGWAGHSILCRMNWNGNRLMVFFWLLCHLLPRLNAQLQKEIPTSLIFFALLPQASHRP